MSSARAPRALPGRRRHVDQTGGTQDAFGASSAWPVPGLRMLAVAAIEANGEQPRKRFEPAGLDRLADSLRERGVLQPVLVRPLGDERFELIAGERRWRAAQLAALAEIPAYVRADTDDATALELALIENAAREDLTPVEEARTLGVLIHDLGVTQAALSKRIGRSRSDVANTLRLLDLPDEILDLLADGRLSKGHGKVLLSVTDPRSRCALAARAVADGWSVRQLERAAASRRTTASGTGEDGEGDGGAREPPTTGVPRRPAGAGASAWGRLRDPCGHDRPRDGRARAEPPRRGRDQRRARRRPRCDRRPDGPPGTRPSSSSPSAEVASSAWPYAGLGAAWPSAGATAPRLLRCCSLRPRSARVRSELAQGQRCCASKRLSAARVDTVTWFPERGLLSPVPSGASAAYSCGASARHGDRRVVRGGGAPDGGAGGVSDRAHGPRLPSRHGDPPALLRARAERPRPL